MKKLIPPVFTAIAFVILFALGTWQLQRLEWKTQLVETINKRMAKPPITLAQLTSPEADEYRHVTLEGTYDHAHEMVIIGRPFNGKPGQFVITPMKTEGKTILVNRGWVKYEESYEKPQQIVKITGLIRKFQTRNYLSRNVTMDNDPKKGIWFWFDVPKMYSSINSPDLGYYVEIISDKPNNSYPYALPKQINLYNEHLNYAITWYTLSFALLIMYYFRFHRKCGYKAS